MADALKKHGNECFAKGKLDAAIEAYSEAICLEPSNAIYRTNRAMCHMKRENWPQVVHDTQAALVLDSTSIKAHYLLGLALGSIGSSHDEGIGHLKRALDLCKEATVSYKEDILRALLSLRKRKWEAGRHTAEARLQDAQALAAQFMREPMDVQQDEGGDGGPTFDIQQAQACMVEALEMLSRRTLPHRVPDHMCCQISMELMLEPVTTPCGITYERKALLEHLKKVGKFDPISRKPLDVHQLAPNLALKEVISQYLEQHPWAYECNL